MRRWMAVGGAIAALAALIWSWWPAGSDYLLVVVWETHSQGWGVVPQQGTGVEYDPRTMVLNPGPYGGRWLRRCGGIALLRVDYLDETRHERLVALGRGPVQLAGGTDSGVISALPGPVILSRAGRGSVEALMDGRALILDPGEWWSAVAALTPSGVQMVGEGEDPAPAVELWRDAGYPVSVIRVMNMGLWPRTGIVLAGGGILRCCGEHCLLF